ncbi:alpha/beta fold hydrolase [Lichenicoccus sp.]|uniref:alpha/beta fold hydrolase n=1 Tax=Lichenicoccus sp. TaxID=2781899 RepID=UPI003D0A58B4
MTELHEVLGGPPAVWVGHSLGCTIGWAMATNQPIGVALPRIDRTIYPVDRFPYGQWDYMQFYAEHFTRAVRDFEANTARFIDMSYTRGSPDGVGKPTPLASIRGQGAWFPPGSEAPPISASDTLLPAADGKVIVSALSRNGSSGPCAWHLNDRANIAFAAEAPNYGRISLPVLFLAGQWDTVCDAAYGHLAEPMREDCSNLTEESIPAGHMLMLERPDDVNRRIANWLSVQRISATG